MKEKAEILREMALKTESFKAAKGWFKDMAK
jgi:hypothetical protein